jgi:hypothetical protein
MSDTSQPTVKNEEQLASSTTAIIFWVIALLLLFFFIFLKNTVPAYLFLLELLLLAFGIALKLTLEDLKPNRFAILRRFSFVGDAIVTVALIGLVLEIPHIKDFFLEGLTSRLTEEKYIKDLTADKQARLHRNLIASRLGLQNVNDKMVEAYFNKLDPKLNSKFYITDEKRSYESTWKDDSASMTHTQTLIQEIRVLAVNADYLFSDVIGANNLEYKLFIGDNLCFSDPQNQKQDQENISKDQVRCEVEHPFNERNNLGQTKVNIHLPDLAVGKSFNLRREYTVIGSPSLIQMTISDIYLQKLTLTYKFPSNCKLSMTGTGDFDNTINGLPHDSPSGEFMSSIDWRGRKDFTKTFDSTYGPGDMIFMSLVCDGS